MWSGGKDSALTLWRARRSGLNVDWLVNVHDRATSRAHDAYMDDDTTTAAAPPRERRLERSRSDRWITGVCGGLGAYFGLDPILFRIAFIVLTVAGGAGLWLYLAAWLLLPEQGSYSSMKSIVLVCTLGYRDNS